MKKTSVLLLIFIMLVFSVACGKKQPTSTPAPVGPTTSPTPRDSYTPSTPTPSPRDSYTTPTPSPSESHVTPTPSEAPLIESEGLDYKPTEDLDGFIVTGRGTCKDSIIVIPSTHNGAPVLEIGTNAFYSRYVDQGVRGVVIPSTIRKIGEQAFYGCKITSLVIPGNIKTIEEKAFLECPIKTLVLEEGIEQICANAFEGTKIEQITIPKSVEEIGYFAFTCDTLTSVTFEGEPLYKTGLNGFYGSRWLKNEIDKQALSEFIIIDSVLVKYQGKSKTVTVPEGVKVIGGIKYEKFVFDDVEEVIIPSEVLVLADYSLRASVKKCSIPDSIEKIGGEVYIGFLLQNNTVNLPTHLKSMDFYCLTYLGGTSYNKINVYIPENSTDITLQDLERGLNADCIVFLPESYKDLVEEFNKTYDNYHLKVKIKQ